MASLPNRLAALGVAATLAAAAACNDFLSVDNPGAVDVGRLADSTNANLLVNGAIAEFQTMIANTALYGAVLSDEVRNGHVNASYRPIDLRDFTNLNDINAGVYSPVQRARYAADTVADRLKGFVGADSATDVRVARMLALAGYSYTLLGENFCSAPIGLSQPYSSAELLQTAVARFTEAMTVAQAAKQAGRNVAVADSILNLSLVGAARASLDLNDRTKALEYALQVPAAFEFRTYYAEGIPPATSVPVNPYWNAMGSPQTSRAGDKAANVSAGYTYSDGALWVVVGEAFQGLGDPRVPVTPTTVLAMDKSRQYVPSKPKSFGGYVPPDSTRPAGAPMTPGASMRVASGLEAQYIAAEASGGVQSTLDFVNAQRAANAQPASTAATPDEVLRDLFDQKRREFYLDGHRVGDLRRYKAQYGLDFFPTGAYPGSSNGEQYGTNECFVIPIGELNTNPNIPRD